MAGKWFASGLQNALQKNQANRRFGSGLQSLWERFSDGSYRSTFVSSLKANSLSPVKELTLVESGIPGIIT